MIELAPSSLSANFARLGAEAQAAVQGGATILHVDIMDGHFVPNITIGPAVVASQPKVSRVPLDCHLMIERPDEFIPAFGEAGADWISVHQEARVHFDRTLRFIASHACKPGVAINLVTPVHALNEILPLFHHVLVMSVNPGFGGVVITDDSHRILFANSRLFEMTGIPRQDLVGFDIHCFYSSQEWDFLIQQIDVEVRVGHNQYTFVLPKGGGCLPVVISSRTLQNSGSHFRIVTFTDISEQVRAEEKLRGSPINNRAIQEATFDWIQPSGARQSTERCNPWFVAPGTPKNGHFEYGVSGLPVRIAIDRGHTASGAPPGLERLEQ